MFRLAYLGQVEVPVFAGSRSSPKAGDLLALADSAMIAGFWVVTQRCRESRFEDSTDLRTVSDQDVEWLQLRPMEHLMAGTEQGDLIRPGPLFADAVPAEMSWRGLFTVRGDAPVEATSVSSH